MDIVISGLTATDRAQLERQAREKGVEIREDNALSEGHGDMGIFTIIVPVAVALAPVLKQWIKSRTPFTTITVGDRVFHRTGPDMPSEELEAFVKAL
jgi:hypothetical protein